MIQGTVSADLEATVRLRLQDTSNHEQEIEAVLDTGFNGFLTLPAALATTLALTRISRGRALLANGREELFDIFRVTVLWEGEPRVIEAGAVGAVPLLGMSLLEGYDLHIRVAPGGTVSIRASEGESQA